MPKYTYTYDLSDSDFSYTRTIRVMADSQQAADDQCLSKMGEREENYACVFTSEPKETP